jgi:enamine deaminase RidA (YjgF/YER057c/UK114 family)
VRVDEGVVEVRGAERHLVDWTGDKMAALGAGVGRAAEALGVDLVKPVTLVGVAALGEPDLLVEVDAVAVLDYVTRPPA